MGCSRQRNNAVNSPKLATATLTNCNQPKWLDKKNGRITASGESVNWKRKKNSQPPTPRSSGDAYAADVCLRRALAFAGIRPSRRAIGVGFAGVQVDICVPPQRRHTSAASEIASCTKHLSAPHQDQAHVPSFLSSQLLLAVRTNSASLPCFCFSSKASNDFDLASGSLFTIAL